MGNPQRVRLTRRSVAVRFVKQLLSIVDGEFRYKDLPVDLRVLSHFHRAARSDLIVPVSKDRCGYLWTINYGSMKRFI